MMGARKFESIRKRPHAYLSFISDAFYIREKIIRHSENKEKQLLGFLRITKELITDKGLKGAITKYIHLCAVGLKSRIAGT